MTPHPVDLEALAGRQPTHDEISALLAEVRAARQAQLRLGEAAIALCARGLLMVPTAVVFDWLQIIRRAALASTSVPPPQDAARWLKAQDKATAPPVLEEKAQEAGLRPTPRTEPKCMQPPDQPEFWCRYDGSKHSIYCPLFSDNLRGAPPAPALPKEEVAPVCTTCGFQREAQEGIVCSNAFHLAPLPWPTTPEKAADCAVGYCRHVTVTHPHDWACAVCIAYWVRFIQPAKRSPFPPHNHEPAGPIMASCPGCEAVKVLLSGAPAPILPLEEQPAPDATSAGGGE